MPAGNEAESGESVGKPPRISDADSNGSRNRRQQGEPAPERTDSKVALTNAESLAYPTNDRIPVAADPSAPTAIVGLPKIRSARGGRVVVEPSVSVSSTSTLPTAGAADGSRRVPPVRRPMFLSRSPEEMAAMTARGSISEGRRADQDFGTDRDRFPFQPARFRSGEKNGNEGVSPTRLGGRIAAQAVSSPSDRGGSTGGVEQLPAPPPPQASAPPGSIEEVPGFELGPGERLVQPGEDLTPNGAESTWEADSEGNDWWDEDVVGQSVLGEAGVRRGPRRQRPRDRWENRPIRRWLFPEGTVSERLADRLAGRIQNGLERINSTRQRVDAGLGALLVEHAPLVLDTTQPRKQYRFRGDFATGVRFPDRSEYYWAAPPRGPGYQGDINTQEFAFMFELGSGATSVQTEFPVRGYGAELGDANASFGDIRITQKLRMLDGDRWQITQMLRVHNPSGNTAIGGGTGHVAMEPGFLFRFQRNCWTYYHAELKYRTPIGANPTFASDVLTYGFGVSSVWHETLTTAVIPTFEIQSVNFFGGLKSGPLGPLDVDGESSVTFYPGTRFIWDPGGDLGIIELGVAAGVSFSAERFADSALRVELRFGP